MMAGLDVDFTNEEEVKEYLQNVEIEFMFGCEKEHNSDSCSRLGNFLESVRRDFTKAADVYKSCCDLYRNPICCYKTGQYHLLGKGGLEKDPFKAFRCYRTGCIQQKVQDEGKNDRIANSCANMGTLLVMHKDEKDKKKFTEISNERPDYSKADNKVEISKPPQTAFEAYKRSCELKDSLGCNFLSQMYMSGYQNQCAKDWKAAAHYADKACELGEVSACHNLAVMYERGDGVPVDKDKAKELKAKKEELVQGAVSLQFGTQ